MKNSREREPTRTRPDRKRTKPPGGTGLEPPSRYVRKAELFLRPLLYYLILSGGEGERGWSSTQIKGAASEEVNGKMSEREQVDLTIPASEWSATLSYLEEKDKNRAPYVRYHVEWAIKEWTDTDSLCGLEDLVQEYEEKCSHSLPRFSQTSYSISMGDDVEKKTVRTWIDADLDRELRRFTDEETDFGERYGGDKKYGAALAHALKQLREWDREQRLEDRMKRLIEATEAEQSGNYDPAELGIHYNDVDLSRLDGRSRKKKVYEIAQQLDPDPGDTLHRDRELREAIERVGGESVVDEYIEPVVDVLNFKPHPSPAPLYVHESWEPETETGTPTDAEAPAVDRKQFDDMTKEERLEDIRVALIRKADSNGGRFAADYKFIQREVFDRQVSEGYASRAVAEAAEDVDGFKTDVRDDTRRIKVAAGEVDRELLEKARVTEQDDEQDDGLTPVDELEDEQDDDDQDDGDDEAAIREEVEADAEAEMDVLMSTEHARPDGGSESY